MNIIKFFFVSRKFEKCAKNVQKKYEKDIDRIFSDNELSIQERNKNVKHFIWEICGNNDIDFYSKNIKNLLKKKEEYTNELTRIKVSPDEYAKNMVEEEILIIQNEINDLQTNKKEIENEKNNIPLLPKNSESSCNQYFLKIKNFFQIELYFSQLFSWFYLHLLSNISFLKRGIVALSVIFFIFIVLGVDLILSNDFLTEILELYSTVGDKVSFLNGTLLGDLNLEFAMALVITIVSFGSMAYFVLSLDNENISGSESFFKWASFSVFFSVLIGLLFISFSSEDIGTIFLDVFRIVLFFGLVVFSDILFKEFFLKKGFTISEILSPFLIILILILIGGFALILVILEVIVRYIWSILKSVFYIFFHGFFAFYYFFISLRFKRNKKMQDIEKKISLKRDSIDLINKNYNQDIKNTIKRLETLIIQVDNKLEIYKEKIESLEKICKESIILV